MEMTHKKTSPERSGLNDLEILGLKKYKEIELLLKKFPYNGKFINEVFKTKEECLNIFGDSIKMLEKDWDLLTLIRLFDRQTFEHSLGSFIIVRDKIENSLDNGIVIRKGIEDEVGDINIFYRACIFHDIGKISIPKFILQNSLTDKEWVLRFYKAIKKQKNKISFSTKKYLKKYNIFHYADKIIYAENPNEILSILKSKRLRPIQIVPVSYGISRKELRRLKKDYNHPLDLSLFELMNMHEAESYNILYKLGYEKEALIAGNHGNGGQTNPEFSSKAHSSMRIGSRMSDIVDLIYLADVQDALESDRYYHRSFTKLKILSFLILDVERGLIDRVLSYLWIKDEFDKLKKDKEFLEVIKKLEKKLDKPKEKELEIIRDLKLVNNFFNSICVL